MSRPGTPTMPSYQSQSDARMDPNAGRLMHVKVLYTFDDAKTNCLARCPQPIPVRTAMLDASTEVGIIELRTCTQAIANASPELVAKLGQDFTIYAYDYSEYETPLVGQGMLSWALASTSATPTAPATQSQTPVTGRVTRGGLNLFSSNGVTETLEVKLKLVPVPTSLQSDYLESMQKYRNASNFSDHGGDAAAWNNFVQANPNFAGPSPNLGHQQSGVHSPMPRHAFQPQSNAQNGVANPSQNFDPHANQFQPANAPSSRPASRPSTPKTRRTGQQSAQSSRASSTRGRPPLKKAAASMSQIDTSYSDEQGEFGSEQPRKRARVEQASWRGPSALGPGNDSLRVAASTAASIRGHALPTPNTAAAQIAADEPPVRPPTPRPSAPRQLKRTNTSLADDAMMHRPRQSSGLAGSSLTDNEESVATSPESQYDSSGSTPMDIPSSPPLMGEMSMAPSSPPLPRSADFVDSGFGSGGFDDLFDDKFGEAPTGDQEPQDMPPSNRQFNLLQAMPTSELSITEETPGDPSLLPQRFVLTQQPPKPASSKPPRKRRTASMAMSSPRMQPQASNSAAELLPPVLGEAQKDDGHTGVKPAQEGANAPQDQARPSIAPRPQIERRESTASLPPAPSDENKPANDKYTQAMLDAGTGIKRRHVIRGRLEADLAAGKLPMFCNNCGEIETPTWRKCYVRHMQGVPPVFNPQCGEESYLGNEVTERNEVGEATAYRILRRNIAKGEQGWEEMRLCNSCGMWLFKLKSMRPPEKWGKPPKSKGGRKKTARSKSTTGEPQSDAGSPADNEAETPFEPELPQVDEQPFRTGGENSDHDARNGSGPKERTANTELQQQQDEREQGSLNEASAMAALQRAIQASPPKFPGCQTTPIDLEGEQGSPSVRRLLFPSPRKDGQMKTLVGEALHTGDVTITVSNASCFGDITEQDKENARPSPRDRAATPTDQPQNHDQVFKTPTRRAKRHTGLTPGGTSPGGTQLRRSPRFSPSKSKSPAKNQVTPFTATMNQMMSDPVGSPTSFSDQFNMFSDAAFGDASTNFNFAEFTNDGYATDLPMPPSDADYFPVMNDFELNADNWDGGPLLDGELDALLKEANDSACETYFANTGLATEQGGNVATPSDATGVTPGQHEGAEAA